MAVAPTNNFVATLCTLPLLTAEQQAQLPALQQQFPDLKALAQALIQRGWLTLWQAQQVSHGRIADVRLGSYLLLEPIGSGGNGHVFKARHDKMNRLVAVKMLRPDLANDRETVQRFHREIEVIGQLSHPNIVHALEAGPVGQALVLVTEYVEGVDLERLVRQAGPLPAFQACDYIRQAACGLAHAHERGLVHRDIKPSNLILSSPRPHGMGIETIKQAALPATIKILDLGLARLQQPAAGSTTGNLTVLGGAAVTQGTPDYMAPEQALDFHSADSRSDLYSLGCTFYFLLAGQPPFSGGSLAEKLLKHQQAKPPPIERTDLPHGLLAILAKMLAKRPADRYQVPAEVVRDLQAWAGPRVSTRIATRRLALRTGIAFLAASLLFVAFLAVRLASGPTGAAAALKKLHELKRDRPQDVEELRKGITWLGVGHPGTPEAIEAASMYMELPSPLDNLKVTLAQRPTGGPSKDLWYAVLGDKSMAAGCVAVSPNCGLVASGGGDKRIHVWDSVSGNMLYVLEGHAAAVSGVTFAPGAKTLASMSEDQTVKLWDLTTHRARPVEGPKGPFVALAFSPDGKTLAIAEKNAVKLCDVTEARPAESIAVPGTITSMAYAPNGKAIAVTRAADPPIILDPSGGEPVQLPSPTLFYRVVYAPDGQTLALGGRTTFGPAIVSALRGNWAQATCESPFTDKDTRPVAFLAFVPGRKQVVWTDEFGFIFRWQIGTTNKVELLGRCPCRQGIPNPVLAVDGRHLAIADGEVWILRLAK